MILTVADLSMKLSNFSPRMVPFCVVPKTYVQLLSATCRLFLDVWRPSVCMFWGSRYCLEAWRQGPQENSGVPGSGATPGSYDPHMSYCQYL